MSENFIKTDLICYLLISTLILLRKFIPLYMICYNITATMHGLRVKDLTKWGSSIGGTNTIMTTLPVVLHAKNS